MSSVSIFLSILPHFTLIRGNSLYTLDTNPSSVIWVRKFLTVFCSFSSLYMVSFDLKIYDRKVHKNRSEQLVLEQIRPIDRPTDQNRLLRNESTRLRSAEHQQCQEHMAERGQMGASVRGAGKTRYSQAEEWNTTLTLLRCKNQHKSDLNTKAAGRKQGDTSSNWTASGSEAKIKVSEFLSED